eukprot:3934304-Rhodomonas_salina.1
MGGGEAIKPEILAKMRSPSGSATALKGTQRSGSPHHGRPARHMCDARSESQRIVLSGKTLVNIHDCAVTKDFRGKVATLQGVGQLLLEGVEKEAKTRGAGKLTLEVLENNKPAIGSYRKFWFAPYELDPAMGKAEFWQKVIP